MNKLKSVINLMAISATEENKTEESERSVKNAVNEYCNSTV